VKKEPFSKKIALIKEKISIQRLVKRQVSLPSSYLAVLISEAV
jgi:hypothetical protein